MNGNNHLGQASLMWFGQHWGAAICEEVPQGETPVGVACARCEVNIEPEDRGFLVPRAVLPVPDLGPDQWAAMVDAYHFYCFVDAVTGTRRNQR